MNDVQYQREEWSKCWPEIETTATLNFEEVGQPDGSVDVEAISEKEKSGNMVCFTARVDGRLAGYWWGPTFKSDLLGGAPCAFNQAVYVLPQYRGLGIGKHLINFVEDRLREDGFAFIYTGSRSKKSIVPMLTHIGYVESEVILEKKL